MSIFRPCLPATAIRLATPFRSFTTTGAIRFPRAPALGDISPGRGRDFDAKQHEWREKLAEAERRRVEKNSMDPLETNHAMGLIRPAEAERAKDQQAEDSSTGSGKLKSLIYGTPEGRQLDKELEQSFSQVLARGKYVHSIVMHRVKPDRVDDYVNLVGDWYPKVAGLQQNKVNLVGSWRTEVGDCDTFIHIWEYQRYAGYHASKHLIQNHPDHAEFERSLKSMINSKEISLMQEFSFWPTASPRKLGGVFELRSYTLHPGNLLQWEQHWRKGLEARKEVMEGVGAWFVQIGDLNTVHHLWQFADLEERRKRREQSWNVSGWAENVHHTVPLIQSMRSRVLIPMPWSPIA